MLTRLHTRFVLAFVGLTSGLAVLAGIMGVWLINRAAVREANAALTLHLQAELSRFDTLRHEWLLLVETLGGGRRVALACADPGSPATIGELESIRRQVGFDILLLTDRDGRVRTRTTPPYRTGDVLADEPVRAALQGETRAGFVVLGADRLSVEGEAIVRRTASAPKREALALIVAAPARDRDGQPAGTLVAGIVINGSPLLLQRLSSLTVAGEESPPAVVASVYLDDTEVLTTRPAPAGPASSGPALLAAQVLRAVRGGAIWYGTKETPSGQHLVAVAALREIAGGSAASVSVGLPAARFVALRRSMVAWYGGVGLAGSLIAVLVSARLARRLARPINRLARAAGEVASGSFDVRLDEPRARDEVWVLTAAFNRMSEALRTRDERLAAARQELESANASLKTLNDSYLNMIGFVSHELKNILGTMTWSVQALEGGMMGALSAPQARLVHALRAALDGGLAMTRSFLDLARIETGRLTLDLGPCDFARDVAGAVVQELGEEAARSSMLLEADLPESLPITGDANLLRVVVRNLVGNALRYGRRGGRVRVACRPDGADLRCEVWNEGEGLGPEQLAQLFGKFRRFGAGRPDAPRGSGLGLFIVREIVHRHGGTITAESEPGSWMRFVFRLPDHAPPAAAR
ncbi:MAG: ATP-binding protein [Vicinamibacterales bacterium]